MNGNIPETVKELYLWIYDKIGNIEKDIASIKNKPDDMGKWMVRLIQFITLAILVYMTFFK